MKLTPFVGNLAFGVALSLATWLIAATAGRATAADLVTEEDVQHTDELHLTGLTKSEGSFVIFVSHQREKPKPLTAIGAVIGAYELCDVDARQGFADFLRDGAIYRVWLAESLVKHGRAPPPPPDYKFPSVRVVGEVHQPGDIVHYKDMPITAALERAGGPKKAADLKRVKLRRRVNRAMTIKEIDVALMLARPDQPVVPLEIGDVVEVPLIEPPRPPPSAASLALVEKLAIVRAHADVESPDAGVLLARIDGRLRSVRIGQAIDEQLGLKLRAVERNASGVTAVFEEKSGAVVSRSIPTPVRSNQAAKSEVDARAPR